MTVMLTARDQSHGMPKTHGILELVGIMLLHTLIINILSSTLRYAHSLSAVSWKLTV